MLNLDQIKAKVVELIDQSIRGADMENIKVDFKSRWYSLTLSPDVNEFLKDTSSIANTFGLDGLIIIGYDEKKKEVLGATFGDCGLKDSSQIRNIVIKRMSHPFEISTFDIDYYGKIVSVIHLPPSLEKPHIIKNYQKFRKEGDDPIEYPQEIFIRKNTGTYRATKSDIDIMYYDRKNLEPDIDVYGQFISAQPDINNTPDGYNIKVLIENKGRRPFAILDYKLTLTNQGYKVKFNPLGVWKSSGSYYDSDKRPTEIIGSHSLQTLTFDCIRGEGKLDNKITVLSFSNSNLELELSISGKRNLLLEISR